MRAKSRSRKLMLVAAVICGAAIAGGVSIDGRTAPYSGLSNVSGTSSRSDWEIRNVGLTQAAATYRLQHGSSSLPAGSTFTMTWPDSSSEGAAIVSTTSSLGAVPADDETCPTVDDCGVDTKTN